MNDPFINICLILASCWALYIFFYRLILPGIRDRYRYKLFAQRDRLHHLFLSYEIPPSDKLYAAALDMLNVQILVLDELDVPTITYALVSAEEHDRESFSTMLRQKEEVLSRELFQEYAGILGQSTRSIVRALRWNSLFVFVMLELMFLKDDARLLRAILGEQLDSVAAAANRFVRRLVGSRWINSLYPEIPLAYHLATQNIPRQ